MSRWKEQFESHAIHATLEWAKDCITTNFDDVDEMEISEKRRALKIVSKYEDVLGDLDPELIPYNQLDSLNNVLRNNQLASLLNTYKSNGNVAHLQQANDLLSAQLTTLALFFRFEWFHFYYTICSKS